eukprot:420392-Rhodomonas_salina.3
MRRETVCTSTSGTLPPCFRCLSRATAGTYTGSSVFRYARGGTDTGSYVFCYAMAVADIGC